jgi:aryl-alcohol dehydrogenase-like predicted oxidoreductase
MTKLGSDMGGDRKGLSKKYIAWSIEESLKRLKTDCVDLYQSHRDDPNTPIQETLEAYAALIKAGKVRAIGASNFTRARMKESLDVARAHGLPRYESLQPKYNMYDRAEFEKEHMDFCVKENVDVIPYYALANGFLTGKYRGPKDFGQSQRGSRMGDYLNDRGKRILAALDAVSKAHDVKPAAVSLAWLMARPSIAAPIASATKLEQLADFVAAANLKLSPADMENLNKASAE